MKEMFASMRITGKTIEGNQVYSTIQKICARTGIQKVSSLHTKMVVYLNTNALTAMVGRNRSFIQTISKSSNVSMEMGVKNHIVRTITMRLTESILFLIGLSISQRLEQYLSQQTSTCLFSVTLA